MKRSFSFYALAAFFGLFVLFLYGPTLTIAILSFQGPDGGLTFPMRGDSLRWYGQLLQAQAVGNFGAALTRSLLFGLAVAALTSLDLQTSKALGYAFPETN